MIREAKRRLVLAGAILMGVLGPNIARAQNDYHLVNIPDCNSYRLQNDPTLNGKQRTCIWASNLLTAGAVFGAAASSGYGLLTKDEPGWGEGGAGFGRRFAARYAQGITKDTVQYLTAFADKEEPRHKPTNCIAWKRAVCAAVSVFAEKKENGKYRPLFATTIGAAAGGFIGMSFYPNSNTVTDSLQRTATSLGSSVLDVELLEFEPDILHLLGSIFKSKKNAKDAAATAKDTK